MTKKKKNQVADYFDKIQLQKCGLQPIKYIGHCM